MHQFIFNNSSTNLMPHANELEIRRVGAQRMYVNTIQFTGFTILTKKDYKNSR